MNTSTGYSGMGPNGNIWPMSELKISTALALNEIVNAPKEFVSSTPHLVVAQLDWIQTRYLFVKNNGSSSLSTVYKETKPLQSIEQDPGMSPRGVTGTLVIPIHAIAGSRRPQSRSIKDLTVRTLSFVNGIVTCQTR
jgi:ubiquitin-conjugating enzyme E2 Q